MRNNLPPEALKDSMRPPSISTEVWCLHCGKTYQSDLIEWREFPSQDGQRQGFWVCPMPGCDGAGFCFDIFPTDRDYVDPDGRDLGTWNFDDDEEEYEEEYEDECERHPPFDESEGGQNGHWRSNRDEDIPF